MANIADEKQDMVQNNKQEVVKDLDKQEVDSKDLGKQDEEVEDLKDKLVDSEGKYRRALADYQNLQRRVAQEKNTWIGMANKDLLLKLLPVLDTLILAGKHIKDKGLELSVEQFLKVLEAEGIAKIETVGKDFDPLVMECVETRKGKDWKILEELTSGYRFGDTILRPARVIVGREEKV